MMFNQPSQVEFKLPEWIDEFVLKYSPTTAIEDRMGFVIFASLQNVENKTGGPFAAAIFEMESGKLVSLGVNLVILQGLSILHAEMVAIALAQRRVGGYDLGGPDMPPHELVISAEPCAMCFGAIPWSGIRHVVTGAMDKDARSIGFDEGPKPENWIGELESRNIKVSTGVNREKARQVLQHYIQSGGHLYNSREG